MKTLKSRTTIVLLFSCVVLMSCKRDNRVNNDGYSPPENAPVQVEVDVNSKYDAGDCIKGETESGKEGIWKILSRGEHGYAICYYSDYDKPCDRKTQIVRFSRLDDREDFFKMDCPETL